MRRQFSLHLHSVLLGLSACLSGMLVTGCSSGTGASSPPLPIVTINALPLTITLGSSTTVNWSSTNATSCTASNAWSGAEAVSGSATETPTAVGTSIYAFACTGPGGTTSASASVIVDAPPTTVTQQPVSLTVTDGQSAAFSVVASGDAPFTYQWMQGATAIVGATGPSYSIPMAIYTYHNGLQYSVIVTDAAGSQVTSQPATLTVTPIAPGITESPLSMTVNPTNYATFWVAAHGTLPLSYQWNLNGAAISGATEMSYATAPTKYPGSNGSIYTVTVTNGAGQTTTSLPAILGVWQTAQPITIMVDVSEADADVAHQASYRRGEAYGFDIGNPTPTPSMIVGKVTSAIASSQINFLNATLDLNSSANAGLFDYTPGPPKSLLPDTAGSAPIVQAFNLLRSSVSSSVLPAMVQLSGTPAAYSSEIDPSYQFVCSGLGNFYPLPYPGAPSQLAATAIENWIDSVKPSFPGAIWSGTQEPSHTLGFSTEWSTGTCSNPPSQQMDAAKANNTQRFIAYWTPIAQYLRANHMLSGGVQLNSSDASLYVSTAAEIISAKMPLDYYTIQNYTPSLSVYQALHNAYQTFQQDPNYLGVKILFDRYGMSVGSYDYGTASGAIGFLQSESEMMPYADMVYGYGLENPALNNGALVPKILTWLQAAPTLLRPLTSTTSNLQAFALVQNGPPVRAYIAIWNASPSAHTTSVVLNSFTGSFTTSNLTILDGIGTTLTQISNSGITVSGNTISGMTLNPNEFFLISLQ
jgi:hypothetical protein